MNHILYVLIGICIAGVITSAFQAQVDVTKLSTTDFAVTIGFLIALAAGGLAWRASPWSKRMKDWFDAGEDKKRIAARDKGLVRRPPWWYL